MNSSKDASPVSDGYYFGRRVPQAVNRGETLFLVAFSGGGTRAAAMAYGVLEELHRTPIPGANPARPIIDDVNVISSVSGGSFTAAAYALQGEAMFGGFETNFLKRNVQGKLVGKTFSPWNWPALGSPYFGRSDMAAEYYDKILFHGATFSDLARTPGPFVMINATEVSTGIQFWFTQDLFDNICSDLNSYPISRAVAASSAVPVVLSPITLKNYGGSCDYKPPPWTQTLLATPDGTYGGANTLKARAKDVARLEDSATRPYLHLVDGGIADNLGLRPLLDGLAVLAEMPGSWQGIDFTKLRRVILLSVNAHSSPINDWDRHESPPGLMALAMAAPSITMDRYSKDTVDLMGMLVRQLEIKTKSAKSDPIKFYPIVLSFDSLPDKSEREYFLNVPTSFFLSDESVDRLRSVGGQLLRDSPQYKALMADYADSHGTSGPGSSTPASPK